MNDLKNNTQSLSDKEMIEIEGGGLFRDALYFIGYALGSLAQAQERDLNGNIGGPSVR